MIEWITPTSITLGIVVITALFHAFLFFRTPQENLDKKQALDKEEQSSAAKVLAQRVQWAKEEADKRFAEMQMSIKEAFLLATNHTHTVEENVKALTVTVVEMDKNITKLHTIIDERIPRR